MHLRVIIVFKAMDLTQLKILMLSIINSIKYIKTIQTYLKYKQVQIQKLTAWQIKKHLIILKQMYKT